MSKPANKTIIGLFVVSSVALLVAAVLIFGSGRFFTTEKKFVTFFDGSVKGLEVGAPVIFRGVKVGEVKEIHLFFNPKDWSAVIPVYIEINPKAFTVPADSGSPEENEKGYVSIEPLIERGLKAQLQIQSYVTGQLTVNLDLLPDKPAKLVGLDKRYPEIPTVPRDIEQLAKTLQDLDLEKLYKKFLGAVEGVEAIVNAPGAHELLSTANAGLKQAGKTLTAIETGTGKTMEQAEKTLTVIERVAQDKAAPALLQAEKTLLAVESLAQDDAGRTLKQAEKTLAAIEALMQDNATLGYDLSSVLRDLNETSRSLRSLADYLDRHPEALIRGKK
ncbi:MAG: MCE family protein [Nitrospirales bacterium]|nr:MCE family protein [Nitrospirales bacterium]